VVRRDDRADAFGDGGHEAGGRVGAINAFLEQPVFRTSKAVPAAFARILKSREIFCRAESDVAAVSSSGAHPAGVMM
jgi:hypothetical protein